MASQSTTTSKRQRSENWFEEDKMILKELIREAVTIIENKNTDANTNAKKVAAWNNLRTSFNIMAHTPRTLQQIKAQWGIIKMVEKKKKYQERKKILQTGGGPPPVTDPPTGDDISVWLPHEFTVDSNEFDSDRLKLTDNKKEHPEPPPLSSLYENTQQEIEMGTTSKVIQEPLQENVENTQKVVSTGSSVFHPKPSSSKKLKKKENMNKASAAESIASMETACRKELHEVQMANEERKARNLDLEQSLLKIKIGFYTKKNQLLENNK